MFSSLEHCDNFYVNLPSNVPGLAQTNHPSHFKVALPERIQLRGTWEVGLAEIFIPSYGFNIKPPLMVFGRHLHKGDCVFGGLSLGREEETFEGSYPRRSVQAQGLREDLQQNG